MQTNIEKEDISIIRRKLKSFYNYISK